MAKFFLSWALAIGFCSLSATETTSKNCTASACSLSADRLCPWEPKPELIGVSHTEGKGLGYSRGYSSLDLFLSQPLCQRRLIPFLDLRGHIFNDGKYAANAGLGLRWLSERFKQIWGFNAFYDYLQTSQRPYNQVSAGLEALGENWDARLNGYLPVGHKKKNIYRFFYEDLSLEGFLLEAREQFAMRGFDSEIGYRFCKTRYFDLHVGAGPYYYWGSSAKTPNAFRKAHRHATGGRISAEVAFMNYVFLDGYVGYDSLFRWTGQGTLTLRFPFDLTFTKKSCSKSTYCLKERLYRPVEHNEIIVIDSCNRFSTNPAVLDPEHKP